MPEQREWDWPEERRPPTPRPTRLPKAPTRTSWLSSPWGRRYANFVWRVGLGVWKIAIAGALILLIVAGLWLLVTMLTAHADGMLT